MTFATRALPRNAATQRKTEKCNETVREKSLFFSTAGFVMGALPKKSRLGLQVIPIQHVGEKSRQVLGVRGCDFHIAAGLYLQERMGSQDDISVQRLRWGGGDPPVSGVTPDFGGAMHDLVCYREEAKDGHRSIEPGQSLGCGLTVLKVDKFSSGFINRDPWGANLCPGN
jgi:hypothetical protein